MGCDGLVGVPAPREAATALQSAGHRRPHRPTCPELRRWDEIDMSRRRSCHQMTMRSVALQDVAAFLDETLRPSEVPDYPGAVNGLQFENSGLVTGVGAAVDVSTETIEALIRVKANFLLAHHGMFWGAASLPFRDWRYRRVRLLIEHDLAVYASHLPLDRHPMLGNNVLLARELQLQPDGTFAEYRGVPIGVSGDCDLETAVLLDRLERLAARHRGRAVTSGFEAGRRTHRWAVCTGAGVDSEALRAAGQAGIDTLIVGEGPHHSAVEAREYGIVVVYAGHYATETLGVKAVAALVAGRFEIPWHFLDAPTGL
jgi:dinuclear metal center YbgI/SA1388 family protein